MAALQTLTVPLDIRQLLGHRHVEAGFSGGYAWAFQRSTLAVWEPGNPAQPFSHRLPYAYSSVKHFVCIMPGRSPGQLAVLLVSEDGNATLWPDFGSQAAAEPLTSRIPGHVAALAAGRGIGAVIAAAGMEGGSVHLLGTWGSMEPTWRPLQQEGPSSQPVVGLRFEPGLLSSGGAQQQLLVVRHDGLECWAVGASGEARLLRTGPVAQEVEAQVGRGPVALLTLAAQQESGTSSALPSMGVLASCPSGLYLAALSGDSWRVVGCHRVAEALAGEGAALCAEVAADGGASGSALVWAVGGHAVLLDLATGKGASLDSLPAPLLAATAAPGGDAWLLLDAAGALHRLPMASAPAKRVPQESGSIHVETARAPDPAAMAAGAAATRAADAVFQVLNAACQGQLGVASMAQQLASLGALRGVGAANHIARFSRHVLDTLPKIFGAGRETVGDQLQGKVSLHNVLLQCLSDGGCLAQLHPATLRAVFEDGQKLCALADLRELESRLQEQRKGGAGLEGAARLPFPLHEVAVAAGRRCMSHVQGGGDRSPWEVFYACPSVTVSAFFREVADVAASLAAVPGAGAQQLDTVAQLAKAVQVSLGGAAQQRAQYQAWFPNASSMAAAGVDEAEWIVGGEVRGTVQALAETCMRLDPLLSREAPARVAECVALSFDLTERLLNAYAAALAAAGPAMRRGVKAEYAGVRDAMLGHLLRHAMLQCRQGVSDGEALLQRVESLAEAHSGYSLLFDACEFTGDRERLYELMTQLTADDLTEPMAVYVFQRLLDEGRRSELLDLPPQFDAELAAWLTDEAAPDAARRLHIRWLHDLRVGDYSGAARSISDLMDTQQHSVRSARQLLALDKLAAWGASSGWPSEVARDMAAIAADADIKLELLKMQGHLGDGAEASALLDARSLMEAALDPGKDPVGAQVALEAFAAADRSFQQQHRRLFEAAWQCLVAATSWEGLVEARNVSTDEDFRAAIATQPLFHVAEKCYGGGSGVLQDVVPPEEVYALLVQAADHFSSPAAREVVLATFEAGCNMPPQA